MFIFLHKYTLLNNHAWATVSLLILFYKALCLINQPRKHVFCKSSRYFRLHEPHLVQSLKGIFSNANHMSLTQHSAHVFLMCQLSFHLAGFLLDFTSFNLFLYTFLCSLESLCFYKLSVTNFFIFFSLEFHNSELFFHQDFHLCLLESSHAEYIKHGFNLFLKVEDHESFIICNFSFFTVFLGRHFRLEQGHWGSIQVKFSGNFLLICRWFISDILGISFSLNFQVSSSWNRFRWWNIAVWVDGNFLWSLLQRSFQFLTYLAVYRASKSALLGCFFLHNHRVVICTCGNNHRCERVASVHTLVVHDVLRIVLAVKKISGKLETMSNCNSQIQTERLLLFNVWSLTLSDSRLSLKRLTQCWFRRGPWTCLSPFRWSGEALLRTRWVCLGCSLTSFA